MSPPVSEVWTYFTKRSDKMANCKRYFKEVKHCGNTSNLHKHIKSHNIILSNKKNTSKYVKLHNYQRKIILSISVSIYIVLYLIRKEKD